MRLLWLLLVMLVGLAAALAGLVLAPGKEPAADCTSRVMISRGPHGEPVECVCIAGRLSTCFDPGP
ncbi:MAG TPA: hypothetical protein VFT36_12005 [Methylomirabilota bacterium]|nr:hypothetical protein [Methylomirabilota bacterium]